MVEIRELEHLTTLCEHRHFGRAAAALGLSQPALTKSIQRLEQTVGTRLVDRARTGVVPTAMGQAVLNRGQQLLSGAADLLREIALLSGARCGTLTIGIGPAMSESPIVESIASMLDGKTGIHVKIRVDHWRQLSEWLVDRQLDLFIADMTEARRDERFHCRPLPRQKFVWFCRAGHPLSTRTRVTRRDLLQYPLATPRMPEWACEWITSVAETRTKPTESPFVNLIECENYSMLKRIVLHSDSVSAALATTIAAETAAGAIVPLKVKAPPLTTEAGIVTLRGRTIAPLAESLIAGILGLPDVAASRTA